MKKLTDYSDPKTSLNLNPELARRNKIALIKFGRTLITDFETGQTTKDLTCIKKYVEEYFNIPML